MLKKLLIISTLLTGLFNFTHLLAETISKIPLKKPTLTNEEFNEKLSKNILKPCLLYTSPSPRD